MKILFLSRKTLFSVPGGDTVQILKTAEALRCKGVFVDISTELRPGLQGYDLIHVFNLTRPQEAFLQVKNAKKKGFPVALSTIYINYAEYEQKARGGMAQKIAQKLGESKMEYLKIFSRIFTNGELHGGTVAFLLKGYEKSLREICEMVDVFLPNSGSEIDRLQKAFNLKISKPVCVVPNAIDSKLFNPEEVPLPKDMECYKGCVLCVARIEKRKNQLNLLRAMKGIERSLVLVGAVAPNHKEYLRQIQKEAGPNVTFTGHISPEETRAYYRACQVHALISWMETTGLSSLEAAAMGANLVITDRGDTREYFRDDVFYCEPDNVGSIRAALQTALAAPPPAQLQARVRKEYTWERAALKTLEGYQLALTAKEYSSGSKKAAPFY